jgi:hypothetical protein
MQAVIADIGLIHSGKQSITQDLEAKRENCLKYKIPEGAGIDEWSHYKAPGPSQLCMHPLTPTLSIKSLHRVVQ